MTNKSKTPKPTRKNSGSADCDGLKPRKLLTLKTWKRAKRLKRSRVHLFNCHRFYGDGVSPTRGERVEICKGVSNDD